MKALPNAKQAEAYINELTGFVSLVNDFRSTSGPGNISFPVHRHEWPEYADCFTEVMDRLTAKLGQPQRRGAFWHFVWKITPTRSVRIWEMPSVRTAFFIGLDDEGEI